ncbi:LuxR C-terminal-related transcriptional regulator [Mucilaginibacter sp. HMF5004]|uniref:LuxR C-terminal-related transcriptional regulator n=1 Tax=Mucilaginibacter rivuli TaxID=2857527 RepID=UPI001C5F55FA|nr:LuxR C-terminal-related transcriptional regulator [Mucilaginibacter rivuli]MBW4888086.1 LuxR C-terminal-related transcriptional regulator [Mucilaginibacter rivuli]
MIDIPVSSTPNEKSIKELIATLHLLPGIFIIHQLPDFVVRYMSPNGLDMLGLTLEEVCSMTAAQYFERFFNPEDVYQYAPKVRAFLERNDESSISYFQQVRLKNNPNWVWHLSVTRILTRDENGKPVLSITTAHPIESHQHVTVKVDRLLAENEFLRQNYTQFSKLSQRERDVLRLEVLGQNSQQIGEQLFISPETVKTHRKNINRKLNVKSAYELSLYARAFDLVCLFITSSSVVCSLCA